MLRKAFRDRYQSVRFAPQAVRGIDGELDTIQRQNEILAMALYVLLAGLAPVMNVINGVYERAFWQSTYLVISIFSLCLVLFNYGKAWRPYVAILAVFLAGAFSTFSNGGFSDPRSGLGLAVGVIYAIAIVGFEKIRTIIAALLLVGGSALYFDQVGLLESLRLDDIPGNQTFISILMLIAASVGVLLIARYQTAQSRILLNAFDERQTAARELANSLAEAERAKEAESRFLANMSHEIRNPLNALLGLLEESRKERDERKRTGYLDAATEAGSHLRAIVDDILTMKTIEEGDFSLNYQAMDTGKWTETYRALFAVSAEKKKISLELEEPASDFPPSLRVDERAITHVITNLLSNAIKFTPAGGKVRLALTYNDDYKELAIRVSDTGIGISPHAMERLFVRFDQGDKGAGKKYGGTGLGLAITRQLLVMMDGELAVESEEGVGSTFTAKLRAERISHNTDGMAEFARANAETIVARLEGKRVLCVDDSELNLMVAASALSRAEADVSKALSGDEALQLVSKQSFDCVITDIAMPGMDGEELQKRLAAEFPDLPVIAVTGNVMEADADRFKQSGFMAVIAKPYDSQDLIETVASLTCE